MSHKNRKTHDQFIKDVYDLHGDDYSVLGTYVTQSTKIKVKHNICGHEIFIIPKNFLKGQPKSNCRKCKKYYRKSHDQFINEIELKFGKNVYEFFTKYETAKTKIKVKHLKCGYIWDALPTTFISTDTKNKDVCPNCNGGIKYTHAQFIELVYDEVGDEYTVLEQYINSQTNIKMKHNKCGYEWKVRPSHFIVSESRCPECNESKGEKRIRNWLFESNIEFESQKEYENLLGVGGLNLSYDFHLPKYNLLVEFQGEQHEKYIEGFHSSIKKFYKQQEHDKRKRQYAKDNGIKLLEIWYWDFDKIESILKKELI